jgi:hypothetical protein
VQTCMMEPVAAHTSSVLVGRDAELSALEEILGIGDPSGVPGSALLAGDAGVGKTRLLKSLRDRACAEGWQIQAGHCLDFGDSALPYLPFVEALRSHVLAADAGYGACAAFRRGLAERAMNPSATPRCPGSADRSRPASCASSPTGRRYPAPSR